jgi:hypothetical protein
MGAIVFWCWQSARALTEFEKGAHGPFKVTRTSGSGYSYLAVDSVNRKLALVNSSVPEFNGRGELTAHRNMTVVFSFDDLAGVSVIRGKTTATVHFAFVKPIPSWNIHKELIYISSEGVRAFFEKYVPDVKVNYFTKNSHGGVDRW